MNNMKSIHDITQEELKLGIQGSASWHHQYRKSAYVFIGGLDYNLTEGDVLSVFSQYGEIVNINLVRDKKTGKSKGFCFIGYEDQRSTILAVDNFNGIKLCGRTIRVDHVQQYRRPKDEHGNEIIEKGCAPKTPTPSPEPLNELKAKKKSKKTKKEKKKKKKKSKEQLPDDEELKDSSNDDDKQNESIEDGDRKRSDDHHQRDHPSHRRLLSSSPPSQQHDKKLHVARSRSRSQSPVPDKEQSNKRKTRIRSPLLRQKSSSHSPVREKRKRSVDDSPVEEGHENYSSIKRDSGHSPVRKRYGDYSQAKKMHRDRSPIKERRGDRSPVRERRNEKRSNRSRSPRRRGERSHSRERNQR